MDRIFLAYANSQEAPLASLREEEESVYRLLSRRAARNDFSLHRDANVTLPKVAEYLIRFREGLGVFAFSGHAGRDQLLLEDQEAKGEGIAELLGQCPKLKLVVLNGCSTEGQVARLLELPNRPVVIATSAPVEDRAATQFGISFFQALSEQYATVAEAFQIALGAAKAASQQAIEVAASRGIALRGASDQPLWGKFVPEGYEDHLNWKLPQPTEGLPVAQTKPNQMLLSGLLESLAPFDEAVAKAAKAKNQPAVVPGMKKKSAAREQKNAILKALPFPISVHLQKLLAKRRATMEGHDFYDTFGIKRLQQLIHTYNTLIELPPFVMLAQVWDALSEKKSLHMDEIHRQVIVDYFQAGPEQRIKKLFFPLMKAVAHILEENGIPAYVREFAEMHLEQNTDFQNAVMALELKKERLAGQHSFSEAELVEECIVAEEKLTEVLQHLSFLAGYSLVSVRNIDVLRNRQIRTPNYLHRLVRLVQHFSEDPTEEMELLENFLDNASVLMMKKSAGADKTRFLNLTPFVIDENAYVEKAEDHKLLYFQRYEPQRPAYFFKHIYKPEDPFLIAEEETHLEQLLYQFDVFWQLLSGQNVEAR